MNMRILLVASALACTGFAGLALADTASTQPVPYHYGMPLDIKQVTSMTEPATHDCVVVTAEMKFIDSAGKQQDISYLKLSDACKYNS
ncbi:DUF2790 domain-containing protein [Pseudomonas sp. 6D_7.1_Bac1]|jgi:hypothetical protein|uniref:DUF2790 domain-containing protein n=1 Tax=Pseudomonas sp. 6D_7.1_Bac1 TaxID=2971615 RepID=UPI0021C58830|nr:DUF2790 domain-containing protein [Pseudomonas sp. 6D_7.1_Bac1]MCU1747888.1 DUF2790 domain-containing protein [Pseudomonas sp. 6D_7.1_Bac1]